ncbi:hypothetical protein HY605_00320 [Candidatus Peregrinibacteria bacterium]|nr:hypothetical protein [Candidatus Peregrinibacteria bacterium]
MAAKEEEGKAMQSMKATVGAYNEYRLAYPMHKKYEEVIDNLIEYKDATEDIKQEVMQFPGKFIDATTSQCI